LIENSERERELTEERASDWERERVWTVRASDWEWESLDGELGGSDWQRERLDGEWEIVDAFYDRGKG